VQTQTFSHTDTHRGRHADTRGSNTPTAWLCTRTVSDGLGFFLLLLSTAALVPPPTAARSFSFDFGPRIADVMHLGSVDTGVPPSSVSTSASDCCSTA
jgi:hypothetical protein